MAPISSSEYLAQMKARRLGQARPNTQNQPPQPTNSGATGKLPKFDQPPKEEIVLKWSAPSRPFKKRNRQYYTTIAIIVLLISAILFFAGQFLPIAVVISVAFLAYVSSSIEPNQANYQLTTYGVRIDDELYYWEELGRFWFEKKYDDLVMYIETARFPFRLTMLLGAQTEEALTDLLDQVLIKEKPQLTAWERMANLLQQKIPLDNA